MCGLFGWQWSIRPSRSRRRLIACILGREMASRGRMSYGWSLPGGRVARGTGPIVPHVHELIRHSDVLAHTRYATCGRVAVENAHPFREGSVLGAHNGIIDNCQDLNAAYGVREVDSQHLIAAIAGAWRGERAISEVRGYGSVAYRRDECPGRIYLARVSASGELCAAQTPHGVVWASTEDAVRLACRAADVPTSYLYRVDPGVALYAEGGALFVDADAPSHLLGERVSVRDWRDGWASAWEDTAADVGEDTAADVCGEESEDDIDGAIDALIDVGYTLDDLVGVGAAEIIDRAYAETMWQPAWVNER